MVSLSDLNDDDSIFSNRDIKQTQIYTHTDILASKTPKNVLLFFCILLTKSNESALHYDYGMLEL